MNIKHHSKKCALKVSLLIVLCTLYFPSNFLALTHDNNHTTSQEYGPHKFLQNLSRHENCSTEEVNSIKAQKSNHPVISWTVVVLMSIIFVISPYLAFLSIRFLKDQPLIKQCIMNNLCRDLATVNTFGFIWLWSSSAVLFKIFECLENWSFYFELANCISLANEAIFFLITLYLSLVASVRFYTTRYHVLDPLEEWLGEYENMSMTIIRLAISSIITFIIIIICLSSTTPLIYYKLIRPDLKWGDIPWGSRLLYIVDMLTIILCAILFATWKINQYSRGCDLQNQRIISISRIIVCCNNNQRQPAEAEGAPVNVQEPDGKNEFTHMVSFVTLMYIIGCLLALLILLLLYIDLIYMDIWLILTTFVGIQGVIIPLLFFASCRDIKLYWWMKVKSDANNICLLYTSPSPRDS